MTDKEVLEWGGWIMECESPLEISFGEDSYANRASGVAATIIIEHLRRQWEHSQRINNLFAHLNPR